MATPPATSSTPAQLGKYTISEVLGKGAMGVVYKGFDPHIRRTVALKTIRKELVDDDQAATLLARFRNEAQAAGRLSHPGIVGVYEWGEVGDLAFLAMEYVEGNSLREYFNRGTRFDARDAVSVMAQLLEALHYAHEQGVWHRDIKPANIIIMHNGKLKIADFGIARIDSSNLTQIGAIMGTPGYMAPEQYSGPAVDWRADIFSAGVVMYQLLTGSRPFIGSPESIAYKICHEQAALPSEADPGRCTTQFDAVTMKALAKNPSDRFQTAHSLREAMLAAYAAPVSATLSEETIINEVIRRTGNQEPSQPSHASSSAPPSYPSRTPPGGVSSPSLPGSSPGSQPPSMTVPPPGWDAQILKQVEQQLARIVGPMAKVMIKRGASSTSDIDRLYRLLSENLTNADDRVAFLAGRKLLKGVAARETGGTTVPEVAHPGPGTGVTVQLTPEAIEQGTRRLTNYLGPIAKVISKKAATQATSRRHFYLLLADKLTDPNERAGFLRDVGVE
jgi:eukaryotic-like serine/threonine-protein kinase